MAGTFVPLSFSNLSPMESAFAGPSGLPQYGVAVGLGAVSRIANGQCMQRHVTNSGICWGQFDNQDTKFVNTYDTDISGMLGSNQVTSVVASFAPTSCNAVNVFQSSEPGQLPNGLQNEAIITHDQMQASSMMPHIATLNPSVSCNSKQHYGGCRSYGSYSGCPNCFASSQCSCK